MACTVCSGTGIRFPATPSCKINIPPNFKVLERCDTCQMFKSDYEAGSVLFFGGKLKELRVVKCEDGGDHILVLSL